MAKNSQGVHKAQLLAGTDLTQAELIELAEVREGLFSLGRRKTGEAIALGGYLVRAKAILPEKALGKWVKEACGFTPRTASNYIGVAEHLAPHRDRGKRLDKRQMGGRVARAGVSCVRGDFERVSAGRAGAIPSHCVHEILLRA